MDNTSFPTLDLTDLVNDVEPKLKKEQAADPLAGFAEEIKNDEFAKTMAAARWSRQHDPQSYARAKQLAPDIEPEVGIRQLETLEDSARLARYKDIFSRAPALSGYFAEKPKDLAFANPDDLDNISGLSWVVSAVPAAINEGFNQVALADASNRIAKGQGLPGDQAYIDNYKSRSFGHPGFWGGALTGAFQQVGPLMETANEGLKGALLGTVAGGAVGSVVPGAGTLAGATFGAAGGATTSAFVYRQRLQAGLARVAFQQIKDENGQSLDPQLVELAAQTVGAGGALLESIGIASIAKVIPGSERLTQLITQQGMTQALTQPTVRAALLNFTKNTSSAMGTEIITEVLQQGLQIAAGEAAKLGSDGDFTPITVDEAATQMYDAGAQAFQIMALIGPLASSTRFGADIMSIQKSARETKALETVIGNLEGNQLIERNPELAAQLIDRQVPGKDLYIPAQEAVQLFQENGMDIYGPAIPNWRDRLTEALAINGDVKVTLGEYVTAFGKNPKDNPLATLVRTAPDAYNQAEMTPYLAALDDVLASDLQRAQAVSPDAPTTRASASPIEVFPEIEALKKEIARAGFAPPAIDAYTTMLSAYFQTMATRAGRTPSELFNEFKLSVESDLFRTMNELSPTTQVDENGQPLELASPKGSFSYQDGQATIKLFEGADMSTLLHESGHFFLDTVKAMADASADIKADWDLIKAKLKIGEDNKITREQHEQFARMAEAYFFEGKAPSPELKTAFDSFKRWLKTIYQSIRNLGGKVSPDIAGVFDRMFVTEQRFQELATDTAYAPLFDSAEAMGITPEAYLEYQNLVEGLKADAQEKTINRIEGQAQRLTKGWRGEILKQLTSEMEAKLSQTAPYKHIAIMKERRFSIDPEAFNKKYSKEAAKKFPSQAFKKAGLDPEVAAELLGYPKADDMVNDFVNALPLKEAAKQLAMDEMTQRYGDNFNESGIMDAVIKQQMAQEGRVLLLGKELEALSKKAGRGGRASQAAQLAQQIARDTIYGKRFMDIDMRQAQSAARRAASMAQSSMVKGDWRTAADWKRKQLLAQAIDNEVQAVATTVNKIRDKAARWSRTGSKTIDPSYMEQIRSLVENYDFAKISGKKLKKRMNLRQFVEEALNDGQVVVDIPERLLDDANKTSYKELTVEDLIGLGETLDNLEHLGRAKNKLKAARAAREFNEVKQEIITSINKLPKKERKKKTYTEDETRITEYFSSFHATLLKPEQIVEWLDAGNIKGPMMEHIFQPIADAQVVQNDLNFTYNKKIMDIFEGVNAKYLNETVRIDALQENMTKQEIYAVALNTGNDSNRKKLLEGELWNEGVLIEVLSHMNKEDWDRVQKVWDTLDSLWTKVSAMEKRLTGVTPPKIAAREFTNEHGTYAGGYYPVVYDFRSRRGRNLIEDTTPIDKRFGDGIFSQTYVRPGTNHKHTVKRTRAAKPLKLELGILPGHINNVIHDLAYREAVRDAYKILWDPDVRQSIEDAESPHVYEQLQHWLRAVAVEHATEADPSTRFIQKIRTGATMFGMGFRLTTVLAQPLGLFNSMVRVNKVHLMNGVYQMTRHPYQTWEMVSALSGEMKHRFNNQERDIRDSVKKLSLKESKLDDIRRLAFTPIAYADRWVSTATWLGAYQEHLSKTPSDSEGAIRHADRTVRLSQGTGSVKDMAKITNSSELMKLFTMFYSFFSAQYNAQVDLTRKTSNDIKAGNIYNVVTERLPQWLYLTVFPAIFGALVSGQGPEEDENKLWWATKKAMVYPTATVPFVRDVIGAWESGFDYKMSPMSNFFNSSVRALENLGEGDIPGLIKPAATAGAIAMGLPAGQAINTVEALWKGLENGDFEPQDLLYGRRGR